MDQNLDAWRYRRRAVALSLCFIGCCIVYLLIWGRDGELHKTIADALTWGGVAILMAYIAGAVVDDTMKRREQRITETEKWKSGYFSNTGNG